MKKCLPTEGGFQSLPFSLLTMGVDVQVSIEDILYTLPTFLKEDPA
jgi:hypothetical protein